MNKKHAFNTLSGQQYQDITTYDRLHMPRHTLDWQNVPRQTKSYPALPTIALETGVDLIKKSFWQVMEKPRGSSGIASIDIKTLSEVFRLAYGYTARQRAGGQTYLYRSVPSAGALYPVEIYVSGAGIPGLPRGLFHYDIQDFSIRQLLGEEASALIAERLSIPKPEKSWVSFILSGIFFRSAWKYRKRAFRYVLLDTGHLVENLTSALAFEGLPCSIRYDFVDENLCSLVGLDRSKEACFAIVDVRMDRLLKAAGGEVPPADPMVQDVGVTDTSRVSFQEVTYDAVKQIYFTSSEHLKDDRPDNGMPLATLPEPQEWFPVRHQDVKNSDADYVGVIQGRRSRRNFVKEPIPAMSFMRLLWLMGTTPASDTSGKPCLSPVATGFLVGHVEGFDQGFYRFDGENNRYGLLKPGSFVAQMAGVCLEQLWLANAGALFSFVANLKALDDSCGARGYRHAMMEAGVLAQLLYMGSTALGLGCCGIGAFYDNEARVLLDLDDDSYMLYLVAVGKIKK